MNLFGVTSFLLSLLVVSPCLATQSKLYSVHPSDESLHEVDVDTGATSSLVPLIGAENFLSLATHPETDVLYAVNDAGFLFIIGPAIGTVTLIGDTDNRISSLAFDCSGILYGVSGSQGTPQETLYEINVATGMATQLCTIGSIDASFLNGVAIAWHPVQNKLYYSAGEVSGSNIRTYGYVESILRSPGTNCPLTEISIDLGITGSDTDTQGMTFSKEEATFLYSVRNQRYFHVDADGTSSYIATLEDRARAFSIVPSTCRGMIVPLCVYFFDATQKHSHHVFL